MSKIREEFEGWATKNRFPLEREEEGYFDDVTESAWASWKTAWKTAYEIGKKVGVIVYKVRKKRNKER